jgi:hypothetical protein
MDPLTKLANAYLAVLDHPDEYMEKVGQSQVQQAAISRGRARQAAGSSPSLPAHATARLNMYQNAINQAMSAPVQPSSIQLAKK